MVARRRSDTKERPGGGTGSVLGGELRVPEHIRQPAGDESWQRGDGPGAAIFRPRSGAAVSHFFGRRGLSGFAPRGQTAHAHGEQRHRVGPEPPILVERPSAQSLVRSQYPPRLTRLQTAVRNGAPHRGAPAVGTPPEQAMRRRPVRSKRSASTHPSSISRGLPVTLPRVRISPGPFADGLAITSRH